MNQLTEFLFPVPAERRAGAIFSWWERRRLAYNLWVGSAGAFTVGAGLLFSVLPPHAPGLPGAGMWVPVLIFGVMANVFYSAGAVVEVLVNALWGREILPVGPALYRIGLTFSVGLALFPTLIMVIGWILKVLGVVG